MKNTDAQDCMKDIGKLKIWKQRKGDNRKIKFYHFQPFSTSFINFHLLWD